MVSRVFHNRLRKGMPLGSCATVRYALNDWRRKLTHRDLEYASPYNTYINAGLPPGPICNPGRAALSAAAHPAEGKWLYFVLQADGKHHFSTSLREHNAARRRSRISSGKGA